MTQNRCHRWKKFAELAESKFFSKFDFCKGYWQIGMKPEDRDLTTFVTHRGLFRFTVMPFGSVNAPATFSRIMRKLTCNKLRNYLDDVLSYSKTWNEHLQGLRAFLSKVREANLSLRPSKCSVGFTDLTFLGHTVGQHGASPSEHLVDKILQAPAPKTKKQTLRSFLRLVGFYRAYVPNSAAIAVPLTDLTKKGLPNVLQWSDVHERAFSTLKRCVCNPPVLQLPDVTKPFILQMMLHVMVYEQESEQTKHPVAFASRKLLPREQNYSIIEREALAIVCGVKKYHNYLYGQHFYLETDHHPLQFLNEASLAVE